MAKEMIILLVYDTQMLQKEEDDPASAILYFHPTWVSDQQKTALCGQLMGTVHCVKSIFSIPKIVSLQSGKFFVKEYGRYLMAVGTDRNIADWLLEHRANTMSSLISFFHQDIEIMSKVYPDSGNLSAKLYELFETYLKYLFLGGNIFSYTPSLKLPKSASNVFLEAIQILQCCQELGYVMGGTLLYHNKVVATQLSSDITKRIVLTDPYRIKCPAKVPTVNFDLPIGVQLLQVYITNKEYSKLHEDATRSRNVFQFLSNKSIKKHQSKTVKEPVMSAMKRDQSLMFTAVPEEDSDHQLIINTEKPTVSQRPKFLNLKCKTTDVENIEKKQSFLGQTSVCSTPMTDLSKVIHPNLVRICTNTEAPEKDITKIQLKKIPCLKLSNNGKKFSSLLDVREKCKSNRSRTITDPNYPVFRPDGTVISHSLYQHYLSSEMELITSEISPEESFHDFDSNLEDFVKSVAPVNPEPEKVLESIEISSLPRKSKEHRKSLTLPLKSLSLDGSEVASPVRRHSSSALLTPLMSKLSSFTFDDRSSGFCSKETTPIFTPTQQPTFPFPLKKPRKLQETNDGSLHKCVLFVCGQQEMVVALLLQEEACTSSEVVSKLWEICTENLGKLEKQLHHCLETYPSASQNDSEPYSYLYLDPNWDTIHRGGPWGSAELGALTYFHRDFQAVPNLIEIVMSSLFALTTIAHIVVSSIYLQKQLTRIDQICWGFHIIFLLPFVPYILGIVYETRELLCPFWIVAIYSAVANLVFFILVFFSDLGSHNMTNMALGFIFSSLISVVCSILVGMLFKRYTEILKKRASEVPEFDVNSYPIRRFGMIKFITVFLIACCRCCDGVIYGYQCGKSEVFYHQNANPNAGLPTPADPMSNVPLKAKRRLERDHSIILL